MTRIDFSVVDVQIVSNDLELLLQLGDFRLSGMILSLKILDDAFHFISFGLFLINRFDKVLQMAETHQVYTRDAAYMEAIQSVIQAMELRGWL